MTAHQCFATAVGLRSRSLASGLPVAAPPWRRASWGAPAAPVALARLARTASAARARHAQPRKKSSCFCGAAHTRRSLNARAPWVPARGPTRRRRRPRAARSRATPSERDGEADLEGRVPEDALVGQHPCVAGLVGVRALVRALGLDVRGRVLVTSVSMVEMAVGEVGHGPRQGGERTVGAEPSARRGKARACSCARSVGAIAHSLLAGGPFCAV